MLDGVIPLLLLLRAEAFQILDSVQHTAALLRIHVVEPAEHVEPILLHLPWEFTEAGLTLKSSLLFPEGETTVALHPPFKMLLALRGVCRAVRRKPDRGYRLDRPGFGSRFGPLYGTILLYYRRRRGGSRLTETSERRRGRKQNKCSTEIPPG